ncbi:Zinc finger protein 836 [Araneus ventricosus]|uniref:Zinc finger protein 836 n=1 Tax=Araneus ventricosus TaxID=182803 RepID=A0A4Y2QMJ3_ARAVE|nr:Zinc finger protein 836 [Araneus ventricosus]
MEETEFKCVVCDKTFSSRYSLTYHYANHTPRIRFYVCDICNKGFYFKGRLNIHMKAHSTKNKSFVCCICGSSFKDEGVYKRHCNLHIKDRTNPFSCEECGKTFTEKLIFEVHQLTHTAKTSFRCEVCAKIFFEECVYLKHKDGHKLVLFKCNTCSKEFDSSTRLKRHEESHKPRTCSLCLEVFHDEEAYFNHWVAHENVNTPTTPSKCNTCGYCQEEFKTQNELKDHVEVQHKYWCSVCSIDFQTIISYKRHINMHTNESSLEQDKTEPDKFTCNVCNKEYKTQAQLSRHLSGHDPKKPFGCEVCGKFFDDESFLKTHRALHVQKELQKCDICGKEFTETLFYNIHRLTHFEQKPIRCDICEDVFTEKIAYVRHRRNHKNRELKEAQRFLTMREMLKQKLEESEKSPGDDAAESEMILGSINDETSGNQIQTRAHTSALDPSKLFHCDFCGKLFEEEKMMKTHRDGHVKKKRQICDICGDIFTENYLFLRHRNSHRRREDRESKKGKMKRKLEESGISTGLDKDVSENCESNNNQNGDTRIKIEEVASIGNKKKTYFCDLCGKVFDDEDSLKTHQGQHAQKKLIFCDVCGKEFKEMLFYDIHRLTHLEQKPFRCDICGDIFTEEYLFIRHRSLHKNREQKQAKRIFNMREMLKQKLEESQ